MTVRTENTLAGYARVAVEMKTRMHGYCASSAVWTQGEPYVLAPAMTAVVAAAAEALDLTGDLLTADAAPTDGGVFFLPEPIHHRNLSGQVSGIAVSGPTTARRVPPH